MSIKPRTRKKLVIALGVFILLATAAALLLPRIVDPNQYRDRIVSELEKALGGDVRVGRITWGITSGLWVEVQGFSVAGSSVIPVDFELPRTYGKISLLPLLGKKILINELVIENPVAAVRLEGKTEGGGKGRSGGEASAAKSGLPVDLLIREVRLTNGRVTVEDSLTLPGRKIVRGFDRVDVTARTSMAEERISFAVSVEGETTSGFKSLTAEGMFSGFTKSLSLENPLLKVHAKLFSLATDAVKPYLHLPSVTDHLGGDVSLEVSYEGDLGSRFRAEGIVDLAQFTYSDPALWTQALPREGAAVAFKASARPDNIAVEELKVTIGRISLSAKANVQDVNTRALITNAQLSGILPLADTVPLIPWHLLGEKGKTLHAVVERGGTVSLESLALASLDFRDMKSDPGKVLADLEAKVSFADLSVRPTQWLPSFSGISGQVKLERGMLSASELVGMVGPLTLPVLEINAADLLHRPSVTVKATGPMRLLNPEGEETKKLLMSYGLDSITVDSSVDLTAGIDFSRPDAWTASGVVVLESARAESYPPGALLEGMRGALNFSRGKSLEIAVSPLEGTLNGSPIWLDGKLTGGGTPQALLDLRTKIGRVDFTKVAALIPTLKDLGLHGSVEADLDIHAPYTRPQEIQVKGTAKVGDLRLRFPDAGFKIDQGSTRIGFKGNAIDIQDTHFLLNDQEVTLLGNIANIKEPTISLQAESPSLDLDRLIPPRKNTPAVQDGGVAGVKAAPKNERKEDTLPSLLRVMTVKAKAQVDRGMYRGQAFKNLTLDADYAQGVLRGLDLKMNVGEGTIRTTGTADLRDPGRVTFSADPKVEKVPMEMLLAFLGIEESDTSGPLTLAGHMEGLLGTPQEMLGSLKGKAAWECGPGRVREIGGFGTLLLKILTVASVSSLKFVSLKDDLSQEGISFEALKGRASITKGMMTIEAARLESKALNIDAIGTVDLSLQQVDGQVALGLFGTVDKILGWVPLAGKVAERLTKVYLGVEGPLADPVVLILPIRGVFEGLKEGGKSIESLLEDLTGSLQESQEESK